MLIKQTVRAVIYTTNKEGERLFLIVRNKDRIWTEVHGPIEAQDTEVGAVKKRIKEQLGATEVGEVKDSGMDYDYVHKVNEVPQYLVRNHYMFAYMPHTAKIRLNPLFVEYKWGNLRQTIDLLSQFDAKKQFQEVVKLLR